MSAQRILADFADIMSTYDPKKNTTPNVLSRYERAKILGMRMEQLARGAPTYIHQEHLGEDITLRDVALRELTERKLPFMLVRELPNGAKEHWRLDDLII